MANPTKKKKQPATELKTKENKEGKSGVLQRLAQASIEGLAMEVALNTVIPGAGLASNSLRSAKGIKKASKIMGKSAAKEGVKMLDEEENLEENPLEEVSEDVALEVLTRMRGRG